MVILTIVLVHTQDPFICIWQKIRLYTPVILLRKDKSLVPLEQLGVSTANHLHFSISVGNGNSLAPGQTGWIQIDLLPDFDPVYAFPEYSGE